MIQLTEPFSLNLSAGKVIVIIGAAGSGKTHLIRSIQKKVNFATIADERVLPRRGRVKDVPNPFRKQASASRIDEAISIVKLKDKINSHLADLSPSEASAACLLPVFCTESQVVIVDMLLDWVDLSLANAVIENLKQKATLGGTVIIATHSPEVLKHADEVIALRNQSISFQGTLNEGLSTVGPSKVTVMSQKFEAIRQIVDPITVNVEQTETGATFELQDPSSIALTLLSQGYGDIKAVTVSQPTVAQFIQKWI